MFPVLLEIPLWGGIRIYTYGVLVAFAFITGIWWTLHETRLSSLKSPSKITPERVLDLSFYLIVSGLIGARLLYVIVDWQHYLAHPLDLFKIWQGGLVFYGGFLGAIGTTLYYLRRYQLPFFKVADLFAPGIALAHAIGRLGCFFAGCCYGIHAPHFPFSITFPGNPFSLAPKGIPLFPSQLFESFAEGMIFLTLVWIRQKKHGFEGRLFLVYIILYSLVRSLLEIFRGDLIRGFVIPGWISTSQMISLCFIVVTILIYIKQYRQKKGVR